MYSHGKAKCGSLFLKPQPFEVRCVQRQEELHLMKTENDLGNAGHRPPPPPHTHIHTRAHTHTCVAGGQAQGIKGMSHEWGQLPCS